MSLRTVGWSSAIATRISVRQYSWRLDLNGIEASTRLPLTVLTTNLPHQTQESRGITVDAQ
jgi:hypothetical protein